jgi:hypothetical protein
VNAGGRATVLLLLGSSLACTGMQRGESPVIGDMRNLISAQTVYAASNAGHYGPLACLAAPADCLGDYTGPRFLDERLAALPDLDGYARRFYPGPAASPESGAAPGSFTSWALLSVPFPPGEGEPQRSFCADSSGAIRFALDPMIPVLEAGLCPGDWALLQ